MYTISARILIAPKEEQIARMLGLNTVMMVVWSILCHKKYLTIVLVMKFDIALIRKHRPLGFNGKWKTRAMSFGSAIFLH